MSAQFMFGPNDLALRICAARDCPDDSVIGSALCERHEHARLAGRPIQLHALPEPQDPTLKCGHCQEWKPDAAFPTSTKRIGGPPKDRRGRHNQCTTCNTLVRRAARAQGKP